MKDRPLRLLLLCMLGTSSHFLAARIRACAEERGIPLTVEAAAASECSARTDAHDLVLLEPQVNHLRGELQERLASAGIPLVPVEARSFARMDGCAVLDQVLRELGRHR